MADPSASRSSKRPGSGNAHHVGAVVAGVSDAVRRPGRTGGRDRRVDPLVAVDRRVGKCAEPLGVPEQAAQEVIGALGQPQLALPVLEEVLLAVRAPAGDVQMATVASEFGEGLRHEGGAQPMQLRNRLDHEAGRRRGGPLSRARRHRSSSSRTGRWRPRGRSDKGPSRASAWRRRSARSRRSAASLQIGRSRAWRRRRGGRRWRCRPG